jgi:hypothetical protein
MGRWLRGRNNGGNVNNIQYKSHQNCHYESPPYNEYILIKIYLWKGTVHQRKIYTVAHIASNYVNKNDC